MKILRRKRRVAHLDVSLRSKLQKTLQPSAGVLRPLSLITMRQRQNNAAHPLPFGLCGTNELIHDGLGHINEITELSFPDNEILGVGRAVAILEPKDSQLGKHRVDDRQLRLPLL